ncbi:putative Multidrug resistance-associated protein 1 [Hypsibius exemplaris]|uniref:Multidrug resistance-associated protein 1 n=1 Tax=Hypsibius exemplaris TaxID=2072580 RepID=A0A9X6NDX5_HYPEX|nr:putative Multidrug resistance-associated protein 1 [Hypsibius exemplaris]
MKILKLYAWEESFQGQVSATRELELATLFRAAYVNAFSGFISLLSPFMVAVTTFTTYVLSDPSNVLDAQKAFVSLSLFNILRQPVNNLPDVIAAIIQAQVSIARLTKFLKNDELSPENSFTLKSINFEVPQKSLCAVVDKLGRGKSSLCSAVIGLMIKPGHRVRKGTVAYVSQQDCRPDEGTVAEVGTYKELLRNKGAFSKVLCAYLSNQEEAEESDDGDIIAVKEDIKKEIGALPPFEIVHIRDGPAWRDAQRIVSRKVQAFPRQETSLALEKRD